jgi:hypothetical protein
LISEVGHGIFEYYSACLQLTGMLALFNPYRIYVIK